MKSPILRFSLYPDKRLDLRKLLDAVNTEVLGVMSRFRLGNLLDGDRGGEIDKFSIGLRLLFGDGDVEVIQVVLGISR